MRVITVEARRTFSANCYLVAAGSGSCAVIDPGAEGENIIAALEERGWTPNMILLTHGHYDHIGAVKTLQEQYPGLPVSIHPGDKPFVTGNPDAMTPGMQALISRSGRTREDFILSIDHWYTDGETIPLEELSFTVLETPGHTPGSVCLACGDYLFTGDTLFLHDVGRTDLYGGDAQALYRSIQRLSRLEQDYIVCPGHEDRTSLSNEQEYFKALLEYGL